MKYIIEIDDKQAEKEIFEYLKKQSKYVKVYRPLNDAIRQIKTLFIIEEGKYADGYNNGILDALNAIDDI